MEYWWIHDKHYGNWDSNKAIEQCDLNPCWLMILSGIMLPNILGIFGDCNPRTGNPELTQREYNGMREGFWKLGTSWRHGNEASPASDDFWTTATVRGCCFVQWLGSRPAKIISRFQAVKFLAFLLPGTSPIEAWTVWILIYIIYKVVPPHLCCWAIIPMNYRILTSINPSVVGFICTNLAIPNWGSRAPPCTISRWDPQIIVKSHVKSHPLPGHVGHDPSLLSVSPEWSGFLNQVLLG